MQVIERFKELSKIERCSFKSEAMRDYLVEQGKAYGYEVTVDEAGNVLCHKEGSMLSLQSHYDMVCIGNAPKLEMFEENGWLKAKESTLGADNGMGMAMMLCLMAEGAPVDCLFTADEEVGLLGARALDVPLKDVPMLNLDSEEEGEVTIGCAGGVDVMAVMPLTYETKIAHCYRIEVSGLPGGHSGVDIHKNIPNAIKELVAQIDAGAQLVELEGGERRNSIAKRAHAVIASEVELEGHEYLGRQEVAVVNESGDVLKMLQTFVHGVRTNNDELGIVQSSINLAQVMMDEKGFNVQLSARSMETQELRDLETEMVDYFEAFGCIVATEGFYPPWAPQQNDFAKEVLEANKEVFENATFGAIHAGLECGVIKERYPAVDMASIGPNIVAPHSTAEAVELASVERVFEVVKQIVACRS
jgi:dipeptidase D